MGHALDEVSHRAGLQRLVDILVALIGGEHDETRLRRRSPNFTNDLDPALIGEPEIHQGDVGAMFPEETDRFHGGPRLGGYHHVGLRLNDGGNAEAHDGVIVADKNLDLRLITHSFMLSWAAGDCRCERRTLNETVVPRAGTLTMPMRPPMRSTRSRIPSIP